MELHYNVKIMQQAIHVQLHLIAHTPKLLEIIGYGFNMIIQCQLKNLSLSQPYQ